MAAADFVGYSVLVTLKSPPNFQIKGVVDDVVGTRLSLRDVTLLWNGQRIPQYHIEASGIADLEVSSKQTSQQNHGPTHSTSAHGTGLSNVSNRPTAQPTMQPSQQQAGVANLAPTSARNTDQFVDPAILSFKKPPKLSSVSGSATAPITPASAQHHPGSPVMIADSMVPGASHVTTPRPSSKGRFDGSTRQNSVTAATLSEPFSNLGLNAADNFVEKADTSPGGTVPEGRRDAGPLEAPLKYTGKRSRRGPRNKAQRDANAEAIGSSQVFETDFATTPARKQNAKAGWRQTAFVEPVSQSPKNNQGKKRTKNKRSYAEDPNGWATEEATDIQELGDFDFQTNLSKFDKRRVFEEIRNDDTTAGEERLVSFNRRARPGTNGGKNLHYTENVLDDGPMKPPKWTSEGGQTDEDEASDDHFSSGRNSGRGRSRASMHPQAARKGRTVTPSVPVPAQVSALNRQFTTSRTASPQPRKQSVHAGSPMTGSSSTNGSLRLMTTNRQCPCVSPLQMLEIEQLAIGELGMTEEMVTENAGRGIAEAAVTQASDLISTSSVLVFTGNHRTGARAVSAARHFRNRGYRVTLCILGIDREDEFVDGFRKQVEIFKNISGRVVRWQDLSTMLDTSDFATDLVVDALFGIHLAFEDLRTDDQVTAFEIMSWINRSNIETLSVDIPSGLSASSGETSVVQGARSCVNSKLIVCLGAPKSGLLNALSCGDGLSWRISVADVGISSVAWKKYGTRRRHGVEFGNQWVVPLRFQPGTP